MLVIHWAKHNTTASILAHGIRPNCRRRVGGARANLKGVYVYPFSTNKTFNGTWRHNLKVWDQQIANYNGFVFRLCDDDFPLWAGYWSVNRFDPAGAFVASPDELSEWWGDFFAGTITDKLARIDFEVIIPHHIAPTRIMRVLRDREPTYGRAKVR